MTRVGEAWSDEDIATLRRLAAEGTPVIEIARVLKRNPGSVRVRASMWRIKLPRVS